MLESRVDRQAVETNCPAIELAHGTTRHRWIVSFTVFAALLLGLPTRGAAQTSYYRHTFFDNGPRTSSYYYSSGQAVEPSTLEVVDKKLPLSSDVFFTPPNSVRISWRSNAGGFLGAQNKGIGVLGRGNLFEEGPHSFSVSSRGKNDPAARPPPRF